MKTEEIQILCCTDDGYAMQYGVMLTSLLETNPQTPFHIWILSFGLSVKNKERFICLCQSYFNVSIDFLIISSPDYNYLPLHEGERYTRTGYLPLFASKLLPSSIDKVLYLDGDIIINCSIPTLWTLNIDNYAIAAVRDDCEQTQRMRLGIHSVYINSGVMLINLDYARKYDLVSKYEQRLHYLDVHRSEFVLHDQDIFNYVCDGKIYELPIKYNLQGGFLYSNYYDIQSVCEIVNNQDYIIHFSARPKPWVEPQYIDHPFTSLWREYLKKSPWKDQKNIRRGSAKSFIIVYFFRLLFFMHFKKKTSIYYKF